MTDYNYCPHCGEELSEKGDNSDTSNDSSDSKDLDVDIDYEYETDMELDEALEIIIKADEETVDAMEDGVIKKEVKKVRKMAEEIGD